MKAMESIHDLIEEGKLRAVWWAVCVLFLSYLLSLTSRSIWMNVPIAVFALGAGRVLLKEVDLRWKVRRAPRRGYLAHLQDRQLSPDDPILSTSPSVSINWVRKVDSPVVEHALDEFMGKVLKDFVKDLWYSSITPDEEAPELIKIVVNDVFGEISQRLKDINLVDLLTRDMVKLIGSHLELYRRNQATIGVKVMATLSLDERDEKLRLHLFASKELHPALISTECEYKVLQQLMGGVLAVVLRPREAQCPLVRCLSRELLTCLVMQPIMNLPNPRYINELIESILLKLGDGVELATGKPSNAASHQNDHVAVKLPHSKESQVFRGAVGLAKQESGSVSVKRSIHVEPSSNMSNALVAQTETERFHPPRAADWARGMDAARERRTEVLAPENLENLWAKGRNYKTKLAANDSKSGVKEVKLLTNVSSGTIDSDDHEHEIGVEKASDLSLYVKSSKPQLKRARSFSPPTKKDKGSMEPSISEPGDAVNRNELEGISKTRGVSDARSTSEMVFGKEGSLHVPSIKCRVIGAYFEKSGSKPFAVYSIAVTSTSNETCFVKRRYSNFERLHRLLKDIPNYSLHLPPKRFLSSSIDDYFVHQRCILLDKYLQELLSISNVAEQHEVRDFLSPSSKNYSSGKSTVMQTLSVNVDDAMDDIVRQFKGVSGGLQGKVGDSPGSSLTTRTSGVSLSEEVQRQNLSYSHREESHSASEDEGLTHEEVALTSRVNGWHSDNELDSKQFPPRVVKHINTAKGMSTTGNQQSETMPETRSGVDFSVPPDIFPDPVRVPPEWTPPNVSIPLLNLVDTIFQLKQRGWLRRQVLWISKQVLQLAMEDAIDDWLLRQIHWLRREDVIARGIKWLRDRDVSCWNPSLFLLCKHSRFCGRKVHSFPRQQKEEALKFRVAKAGEIDEIEKILEAEISQLEKLRDGLEAELKRVNGLLTATIARLRNTREEKDQFDEANNQIVVHLKTKDDELCRTVAAGKTEASVVRTWINFLQDTWLIHSSYVEQKEKSTNDELEKCMAHFVELIINSLSGLKEELNQRILGIRRRDDLNSLSERMAKNSGNNDEVVDMSSQRRSLEAEYLDLEGKITTIFSIVDDMREHFYSRHGSPLRQGNAEVREAFDAMEQMKGEFESISRLQLESDQVSPNKSGVSSDTGPKIGSHSKQQQVGGPPSQKSAAIPAIVTLDHYHTLDHEAELAKLEYEFGKVGTEYSTEEIGDWEFDELEQELKSG